MDQLVIPGYTLASAHFYIPQKHFAATTRLRPGHHVWLGPDGQFFEATFIVQNTLETAIKMAREDDVIYSIPIFVTRPGRACPAPVYIAIHTPFPGHAWDAASRFAVRMRPWLRDPEARRALVSQAQDLQIEPKRWLTDVLFPTGVQLALDQRDDPQYIRLGPQWVKDLNGHKTQLAPSALPVHTFERWLEAATYNIVVAGLLDRTSYGLGVVQQNIKSSHTTSSFGNVGGKKLVRLDSPMESVQRARDLFHLLDTQLAGKSRHLLHLLMDGASNKEAAMELGASEQTVRVMRHRISKIAKML